MFGRLGWGYARTFFSDLNDKTIIVASLAKAFGASGGLILSGDSQKLKLIHRYGGPSNWSQSLNAAAIGSGLASIEIHRTSELNMLQEKLKNNIKLFDFLIHTDQKSSFSPIRLIRCFESHIANDLSAFLIQHGFFISPVFFPIVPQGMAAVRITLRADLEKTALEKFCFLVKQKLSDYGLLN